MSSFFTAPSSQRKRKRGDDRPGKPIKRRGVERTDIPKSQAIGRRREESQRQRDESISGSGSESEDEIEAGSGSESEATSEEGETVVERRRRLAERYLDNIRQEVDEAGFDAEEIDRDLIAERLKENVDEQKNRQFRLIAQSFDFENTEGIQFRADTQSTTAIAICQPFVYTVSKDKTLIKWLLSTPQSGAMVNGNSKKPATLRRRPKQVGYVKGVKIDLAASQQHGHTGAILSVAVSPDGRYVATGGQDKKIIIWSAEDLKPLKTFTTHRDSVLGLSFAPTSSQSGFGAQLFSASSDRSLKTYSLAGDDSLAYVETLFGHQDHVLDVSAMSMDQCVSVGARDRSARLWRVVDETQLKFLGDSSRKDEFQTGSLDRVAAIPPNHFVTGSDSGAISLWSIHRKKALFTVHTAHGVDEPPPLEQVTSEISLKVIENLKKNDTRRPTPRGITALVALPGTDIVLSGSWDGWIRIWKISDDKRSLVSLGVVGGPSHSQQTAAAAAEEEEEKSTSKSNGINPSETPPDSTNTDTTTIIQNNETNPPTKGNIKGIINSLAIFERRKEIISEFGGKKPGDSLGLCIIAGTGKEPRLGRWMKFPGGKNGAILFEISLKK